MNSVHKHVYDQLIAIRMRGKWSRSQTVQKALVLCSMSENEAASTWMAVSRESLEAAAIALRIHRTVSKTVHGSTNFL